MSTLLWIVAVVVSIPLLAVLAIGYLRAVSPTSRTRKMADEQAQLNKKKGVGNGTYTAATESDRHRFMWFKSNLWSILIVIVGAILVYWGFNTQVRPADAGSWSQNHWLPLLVIWGILAALIAINAKGVATKALQWVLAGVMALLFIGLPMIGSIASPSAPTPQSRYSYGALVPMTSLPQAVWPNLVMQPHGKSARIEIPKVGMRAVILGNNLKTHVVYEDGHECIVSEKNCRPGTVAFYVTNTSEQMNIVSYAFASD